MRPGSGKSQPWNRVEHRHFSELSFNRPGAAGASGQPAKSVPPHVPTREHRRLGLALATAFRASVPGQHICQPGQGPAAPGAGGQSHVPVTPRSPAFLAPPPQPFRTRIRDFPELSLCYKKLYKYLPFKNNSSLIGPSSERHCSDDSGHYLV